MPLIPNVMTEFWTHGGVYAPYELNETVAALRKSGQNIVEAEAFTGGPAVSMWTETPEWLKPIGDAAFCGGVNRMILHRFVQQPWDDKFLPGATMGRWGTHFDRTQTWWEQSKAMVDYWQRCQALLQWGRIATAERDFTAISRDSIKVESIHRKQDSTDIYFVANTSRLTGTATCSFRVSGMQPELWDPVTSSMRVLRWYEDKNGFTSISIPFEKAQSFFVVFRKKSGAKPASVRPDFPGLKEVATLKGSWQVSFDKRWGGPEKPVSFSALSDWTLNELNGIKYYSGTAIYTKRFDVIASQLKNSLYLDLGVVKHIARVKLNGKDLGVVWTAPWRVLLPSGLLKSSGNQLVIEVANVWANRLIGDEQEPADMEWLPAHLEGGQYLKEFPDWFVKDQPRPSKGRYTFTTWNYFKKDSPLVSSGLIGPVRVMVAE
jgi:hypothetical protein